MAAQPTPTVFGRSLRLTDGDVPFEQGDLAVIAGRDNFLQGLQVMIETPYGSDVFNVNYGFDLLSILSTPETVSYIKSLIRLNIVKSLSQDNRVREIKEVVFDDEPRFYEILPDQNPDGPSGPGQSDADENRRTRKRERHWQAIVVIQTVIEGEVTLQLAGTGMKT